MPGSGSRRKAEERNQSALPALSALIGCKRHVWAVGGAVAPDRARVPARGSRYVYMPHKGVLLFSHGPLNGCTCGSRQIPALEPVANRPILHHVLDAMLQAGVDEVIVAGGADVLIDVRACLSGYRAGSVRLDYAVSGEDSSVLGSLQAAAPLVGAAPCIVHVGDGLLDEPLAPHI
ncbi:MAG: hypothetical protein JOZ69_11090, partial [Myxococcales bacterium]|nr:hypothetical protein [Myxococcales bacterium]